jgi:hypothetical protein
MEPTNIITLDHDIEFDTYKESVTFDILKKWYLEWKQHIVGIWYRKSSNGNVHIKIEWVQPLDPLRWFELRAWLRDDVYRLRIDMCRDYQGDQVNRLWDEKYNSATQELKKAEDWQVLEF